MPVDLALLNIEFNVFSKNREHIIHLPNPVRDNVRKFVNDCASRRAEVGNHLFQLIVDLCKSITYPRANGRSTTGPQGRGRDGKDNANQALYQLVARVKDSTAEFPPLSAATSHRGL